MRVRDAEPKFQRSERQERARRKRRNRGKKGKRKASPARISCADRVTSPSDPNVRLVACKCIEETTFHREQERV